MEPVDGVAAPDRHNPVDTPTVSTDWGSVAEWANAGVTACALVAAGSAAWVGWKVLRLERARDQERRVSAARAEQADRVCAWQDPTAARVVVRNGSTLPVNQGRLVLSVQGDDSGREWPVELGIVPPGEQSAILWPPEMLGPRVVVDPTFDEATYPDKPAIADVRVVFLFEDMGGRYWVRDAYGRLDLKAYGQGGISEFEARAARS